MTRHSPSVSASDISHVLSRLTDRDQDLLSVLGTHHVLTTDQITRLYFTSRTRAHERLLILHRLGLLNRFRRPAARGSHHYRWVLAHLGARIHAAATDQKPPTPAVVAGKLLSIAASLKLDHLLASNDFFIRLHAATRGDPATDITEWWNEQTCADACGGLVRPDGHATIRQGAKTVSFWYEHDTGTESHQQLQRKFDRYERLIHPAARLPILLELPNPAREAHVHATLTAPRGLLVATTHRALAEDPNATVWAMIGGAGRHRLLDIDHSPSPEPRTRS